MTDARTPAMPAGWYDDPTGVGDARYWDGFAWTQAVSTRGITVNAPIEEDRAGVPPVPGSEFRAAVPVPPTPTYVPPAAAPAPAPQRSSSGLVGVIVALAVALVVVVVVLAVANGDDGDPEPPAPTEAPSADTVLNTMMSSFTWRGFGRPGLAAWIKPFRWR